MSRGGYAIRELKQDTTKPKPPHECTSWLLNPQVSANGRRVIHKVRDANDHEISLMRFRTECNPKAYRWLGLGTLGRMSPCMGMIERGLAVIMNSGEPTTERNFPGLTTPNIARCILERCANLEEAQALYAEIIQDRCYSHGVSGSIFMMADTTRGLIAENTACHFEVAYIDEAFLVRANAWHLPGMECHSTSGYKTIVGNAMRETQARDGIRAAIQEKGTVALEDCWAIARFREGTINRQNRAICTDFTNSSASLEIDWEHPLLSSVYVAIGPSDQTPFMPVPLCATRYPVQMVDGSWSDEAFKAQKEVGLQSDLSRFTELEARMMAIYRPAQERARALVGSNLAQAQALLQEAFEGCCQLRV